MLNKVLMAGVTLVASTTLALANGGGFVPAPHHACNFYVGADISRDIGFVDRTETHNVIDPALAPTPFLDEYRNLDWGMEGINGDGFLGAGITFQDRFYLGLEGFGGDTSNEGHIRDNASLGLVQAFHGKIEQDWFAGASFIPGVKITDGTMFYARVGWIISKFELQGVVNRIRVLSKDHALNGIQAGLGLGAMITQNIGIRGEWDWSRYENFNTDFVVNNAFGTGFTIVNAVKLKPVVDQFKFGIFYNF